MLAAVVAYGRFLKGWVIAFDCSPHSLPQKVFGPTLFTWPILALIKSLFSKTAFAAHKFAHGIRFDHVTACVRHLANLRRHKTCHVRLNTKAYKSTWRSVFCRCSRAISRIAPARPL